LRAQDAPFCYFRRERASRANLGYGKTVTPDELMAETRSGQTRPVYLVIGEEQYLAERMLAALRAAVVVGGLGQFNEERLVAGETDVDRVLAAAKTVPMMAKQRLIVVRSLERWEPRAHDAESSDAEQVETTKAGPLDRLAEYASAPFTTACLVLVATKIHGSRKLMTLARKGGFLVLCEPLARGALPAFILREAKDRGHPMEAAVADLLAEIAGPDLSSVADGIERLSLFVGPGKPLTEDAIATCIIRMRQSTVWELIGAVGKRDLGPALRALEDVYDPRDRGLRLVGLLAWSVRQLIKFDVALRGGASPDEAARRAGAPPFKSGELAAQVRRLQSRELERWLLLLAEADLELKGSKRPARSTVEDTIVQMCRG
jgi:DNA polymerase-3 subunit delta